MDQLTPGNVPEPNTVWPPPPVGQPASGKSYPFKTLLSYVQGSVPDFRVGTISLYPEGFSIQGKAVLRSEIQIPILAVCLLLRLGFFIAYAVMEYGIRRDAYLTVAWADVRELVLMPKKNRVCLVYSAPNYKGIIKTFSLAFKLDTVLYTAFVSNIQQSIPGRVREGKMRAWTSPRAWVFLGGVTVFLLILLGIYLVSPSTLSGQ